MITDNKARELATEILDPDLDLEAKPFVLAKWVIAKLDADRWIPVGEGLPTEAGEYLCWHIAMPGVEPAIRAMMLHEDRQGRRFFGSGVTHWKPLPKGP